MGKYSIIRDECNIKIVLAIKKFWKLKQAWKTKDVLSALEGIQKIVLRS